MGLSHPSAHLTSHLQQQIHVLQSSLSPWDTRDKAKSHHISGVPAPGGCSSLCISPWRVPEAPGEPCALLCSRGDTTALLTSKILMAFVLFPILCYLHSFFFN